MLEEKLRVWIEQDLPALWKHVAAGKIKQKSHVKALVADLRRGSIKSYPSEIVADLASETFQNLVLWRIITPLNKLSISFQFTDKQEAVAFCIDFF